MEGRDVIREGNVEDLKKNENFAKLGIDGHAPAVYGKDGAMSPAQKAITTPRGNSAYEHPNHTVAPNVAPYTQLTLPTNLRGYILVVRRQSKNKRN